MFVYLKPHYIWNVCFMSNTMFVSSFFKVEYIFSEVTEILTFLKIKEYVILNNFNIKVNPSGNNTVPVESLQYPKHYYRLYQLHIIFLNILTTADNRWYNLFRLFKSLQSCSWFSMSKVIMPLKAYGRIVRSAVN